MNWVNTTRLARHIGLVGVPLVLGVLLAGCTGRGGGWLPPQKPLFSEQATFGFSFSCERSSNSVNLNPPTGRLRIQLDYTDHGTDAFGGPFSIHGEADTLPPELESMICIGQEPPPGGNELIFLGTYRLTTSSAIPSLANCRTTTSTVDSAPCRFEVIVRDNDGNRAPSVGDFFSIKLSTATKVSSELDPESVVYTRAGLLGGGNIEVN